MRTERQLIILEGPDGGGKTTLAEWLCNSLSALYVHCGSFPRVSKGLGRLYVEAMLPALLGYQDVVLDRSWLSEPIYGAVFRGGQDRLGSSYARMLDRVAARCQAQVVLCLPPVERCLTTFRSRKGVEMLDREDQLERVHALYDAALNTALPVTRYDYTRLDLSPTLPHGTTPPHPLHAKTVGRLDAPVVLVGEGFAEVKDQDNLHQWPFVSFSGAGCSRWLTAALNAHGLTEDQLLWGNVDDRSLMSMVARYPRNVVVAFGAKAQAAVDTWVDGAAPRARYIRLAHPQAVKRFGGAVDYLQPILEAL